MKKSFKFILIALVGLSLASCNMINKNTPSYQQNDLQGLWEENNTKHYVRFTTEQSDETGYLYGREWDEAQDITEADLKPKGNGWFKYQFKSTGDLTEIHLLDNGGAEIPKVYVVTKLTTDELEYYEKDQKSNKFYFSKIIEEKLD